MHISYDGVYVEGLQKKVRVSSLYLGAYTIAPLYCMDLKYEMKWEMNLNLE